MSSKSVLNLQFCYRFNIRHSIDRSWGSKQPDGQSFDGMIGMLQRQEIDVAPAVFLFSKERAEGAKYLNPFAASK
jgi:hypothetical protein